MIRFTDNGLYCEAGDFHIDPWRPVPAAVVTHAHSDHARPGHGHYLCHEQSLPVMRARLGPQQFQTAGWGETVMRNGVRVSLHPAGHIIGSAQVRVEYQGEVWVVSGDYKTEDDGLSGAFEPIRCNVFVTESTFGLPVYRWRPQEEIFDEMRTWVEANRREGRSSIFQAYSLGKAQRIIEALRPYEGLLFAHGAVLNMQQALTEAGWDFPRVERLTEHTAMNIRKGCVFITPVPVGGLRVERWMGPNRSAACSGWMQVRGNRRRGEADKGFVLSDHADWDGLLAAVRATGAQKVFVTHGFQSAFSRYLSENGVEAGEVRTQYGGDEEDREDDAVEEKQEKT
ncbi:MAG: ligase-associated DNA damage response exonuclease [Bacteroidetes bacterium]|nr:ligase-associated DNA damage response exonuclease [Bacteroidota bacterium]